MSAAGRHFFACGGFARPPSAIARVHQAPPPPPPPPPPSSQPLSIAPSLPASAALEEPLEQYLAKDLRREVHRLKLKIVRHGPGANDSKSGYIELLRENRKGRAPWEPASTTHASQATERNLTIWMLDTLFSGKFWARLHDLYQRVLTKNKSMLSDTVTIPSFDLYGPQQSVEGKRFWKLVASAMMAPAMGNSVEYLPHEVTPDRLFASWKEVCAAYNGVKLPRLPPRAESERKKELLCLLSKLRQRLPLVAVATIGSFYRTFDPIVPPVPTPRRENHHRVPAVDASLDDELVPISDDDCSAHETEEAVGDAEATECATVSDATDGPQSQALDDEGVLELKREFWRSKNRLAAQNLANAKLQFEIQQTKFTEERLSGSKRRIEALRGDLRANPSGADAQCVKEELAFYERERKRLLSTLRKRAEV